MPRQNKDFAFANSLIKEAEKQFKMPSVFFTFLLFIPTIWQHPCIEREGRWNAYVKS